MIKTDRIMGLAGLSIAIFFAWRTTLIAIPFISDPLGPRVFPMIVCVVLALASLAVLLKPDPDPDWGGLPGLLEVAAGTIIFVGYAELLPHLGFVIATFFAAGFLAWRLRASPIAATLAGAGISIGIYVIFHLVLGLSLAQGPFGF